MKSHTQGRVLHRWFFPESNGMVEEIKPALQRAGGIELNVLLFVLSSPSVPAAVEWLCGGLSGLCEQAEGTHGDEEVAGHVLSGKTPKQALQEGAE